MAQHVETVLLLRRHRLDDVALGDLVGQVAQLAVDPGDEHRPVPLEEVRRSSPPVHRSLVSGDVDGDLGRHGMLLWDGVRCPAGHRENSIPATGAAPNAFRPGG